MTTPRRIRAVSVVRDVRIGSVVLVVLIVVVTVLIGGTARAPHVRTATVTSVAVTSSTLVCPRVGGADARTGGASRMGFAAADIGDPAAGELQPVDTSTTMTSTPMQGTDPALTVAIRPGHSWVLDGQAAATPQRLDLNGPAATYVAATEFDRQVVGVEPQAAATRCDGPTTDAWFAGFSSEVGSSAELLLSNVDTVPAVVNVELYGDSTAPDASSTAGIRIDPGTQVEVHLDERDPGLTTMAAHVVATQGRVVPALLATSVNGSVATGSDWVPQTDGPALTQTVAGIAGGPGTRSLVISDPGDLDATVSVKLVTADESYVPTTLSAVPVDAGSVVSVPLDEELQGSPAAAVVTSDAPVIAGGISTRPLDATGATDFALTPATPPISGVTLVSGTEVSDSRHTVLLLSAPGDDAHVTVTELPYNADTPPSTQLLTVPGGTTAQVSLATLGADDPGPGIVITPDSGGPLYGSWLITEAGTVAPGAVAGAPASAGDITEVPLRTPVRSRTQPAVQQRLTAGLP